MRPMSVAQITWRQIQEQTPEDDKRREAIGGELYVSTAPSIRHQRVSGQLFLALRERLRGTVLGEIDLSEVFARER